MADEYDDDVFVIENGIITNQNVPLILEHDLEDNDGFEIGDAIPDFDADNQAVEENLQEVNDQDVLQEELEGLHNPVNNLQNGFHISVSPATSAAPSSSAFLDQSEILDTSSPTLNTEAGGYFNEGYQSDISELSELTSSVQIQPETLTACFKHSSPKQATPTDTPDSGFASRTQTASTSHVSRELSTSITKAGHPETRNTPQASTSSFEDNSERFRPNPPNSPAGFRGHLLKPGYSQQFPRSNRFQADPQVRQSNLPVVNRPFQLFVKFGCFLLMLVFLFLLAIVACLQGLLPNSYLTAFVVLLIVSLAGAFCCFLKACSEGEEESSERSISRCSYGSTEITKPGSSDSA